MSLFVASINSGSNGNCYYVGNETTAVLIDAGLSCRETEVRMRRLGLEAEKVKAIFISHEHADHIGGVATLSKKFQLPVYITPATLRNSRLRIDKQLIQPFSLHHAVMIETLAITAFPKNHDAADPCSFVVESNSIKVGVFTDIGNPCKHLTGHFQSCHAAFLEANYDDQMLMNGRYPRYLKHRISGGQGHLSNAEALEVFKRHKPPFMSHLFLSHLSANNNCPKLVGELFNQHADGVKIVVASRYEASEVYEITNTQSSLTKNIRNRITPSQQLQLAF